MGVLVNVGVRGNDYWNPKGNWEIFFGKELYTGLHVWETQSEKKST